MKRYEEMSAETLSLCKIYQNPLDGHFQKLVLWCCSWFSFCSSFSFSSPLLLLLLFPAFTFASAPTPGSSSHFSPVFPLPLWSCACSSCSRSLFSPHPSPTPDPASASPPLVPLLLLLLFLLSLPRWSILCHDWSLVQICSTSPPGGNQVDGLPPASSWPGASKIMKINKTQN